MSSKKDITELFEDGEKKSTSESLTHNLNLTFSKPITPMLSYRIRLFAGWRDSENTDEEGATENSYARSLSNTIGFSLGNPMYTLSVGYDRSDTWNTANLSNESKMGNEFYYSIFSLSPAFFPSLSLHVNRKIPDTKGDLTDDMYSISSSYKLPTDALSFRYNINYTRNEQKSPSSIVEKKTADNVSTGYQISYGNSLFADVINYNIGYRGNYSRNKTRQFVTQTGSVLFQRTPIGGLHALGSIGNENVGVLSSEVLLADEDVNTATGINISNEQFHNTGIWVSSNETVDRLYIYVNKNISSDATLANVSNWKVYKSSFNQAGTWTEFSIGSISISAVDVLANIYRYEIKFLSPQSSAYFKVVNMEISDVFDVSVTEIEAYGIDDIPDVDVLESVASNFQQGLHFSTSARLLAELTVSLSYSLDRRDSNPDSLLDSFGGILGNIYSNTIEGEKENFESRVSRNYSASTSWLAHRLLTVIMNVGTNENFDNKNTIDYKSNNYGLSFSSSPLPTLGTDLILTRTETYEFDEKKSVSDSAYMSVSAALYRDINMVSDFGITQSENFSPPSEKSSRFLNSTISARITPELSGVLGVNINWSDGVAQSKGITSRFNYHPGRKINFTGNYSISSSDDNVSTSEGLAANWLPLPVLRLTAQIRRTESDPGPSISDRISAFGTWYLTAFADLRFSYTYSRTVKTSKKESHGFSTKLNCRF